MLCTTYLFLAITTLTPRTLQSPTPSPPPPPPTLNLTHPLTPTTIDTTPHCVDLLNPFARHPNYADCSRAIALLPSATAPGTFHNHGRADPFSLPVSRTHGRCLVSVVLNAGSSTVGGSWAEIRERAGTLNRVCFRDVTLPLFKGGWTRYGRRERIVIALEYPRREEGGDVEQQ